MLQLRKLKTAISISKQQQKLIVMVFVLSVYRNFLLLIGSKKAYTEHVLKNEKIDAFLNCDKDLVAKDIALAINLTKKYIFWKNVCRHQSWQAVFLLQKHQIPFDFFVGINKTKNKNEAHSWVKVGKKFICGMCNESSYFVITHFKSK